MFAANGDCKWRSALQRPCSFSPALLGVPYPLEPLSQGGAGLPMPPTIKRLQDNFPLIQAEFEKLLAVRTQQEQAPGQGNGGDGAGHDREQLSLYDQKASSGPRLVEGRDPNVWHALAFCSHGVWNEENCALMPSICNLLRSDPQVSGRIPHEKIEALNKDGGWTPDASNNNSWIQPEYRGATQKHYLDETTFLMSRGHVPDLEVAVLRLAPGGRLVPHVGSSNVRRLQTLPKKRFALVI